MKSLETRLADRAERKDFAKDETAERAKILADGTLATRSEHLKDAANVGDDSYDSWTTRSEHLKDAANVGDDSYDSWTVADLKGELDNRGVEYAASAKKADLVTALEDHDAA